MSLRDLPPGRRRLERLEQLLGDVAARSFECPVLVEGMRDRRALEELGVEGRILLIHDGSSLPGLASRVSRLSSAVILLTDWDRKGKELFIRLSALLGAEGLKVYEGPWRSMGGLVARDIQSVEDLPSLMRQLREESGKGAGPDRPA